VRAVIQRVAEASVAVAGRPVSAIGAGLLVLVAVEKDDGEAEAAWLARRLPELRIFPDEEKGMNRSLADIEGEILLVSQFTLAARLDRGRRPSFAEAADPARARTVYDQLVEFLSAGNIPVRTGVFGALMKVSLVNDGPVTFLLERRSA